MLSASISADEGLCNEGVTTYTDSTGISVNEPGINSHVDGDDQGEIQRRKPVKGGDRQLARKGLLPTPSATDHKGGVKKETANSRSQKSKRGVRLPETFAITGKTSQLNHRFVLEMMGYPPDWLDLPSKEPETQ